MRAATVSEPSPLMATGLTRAYTGGKGVFDISLTLAPGEVLGLMGPNGSGKSTLLRMLATASSPTAGQVSWFGNSRARDPSIRRRLGVMLDQPAHFEQLSGYQNAWFFARQYGLAEQLCRQRLGELFQCSDLWEARHQRVADYSLGMKRKLHLVEALVHRPSMLLLDEPSLALDYRAELDLIDRLKLLNLTGTAVALAPTNVHPAGRLSHFVLLLPEGPVTRERSLPPLLTE